MQKRFVFATAAAFALLTSGLSRADNKMMLKGGMGFFTSDLGNVTNSGPAWGFLINVQPINLLGLELGYDGSRNALSDRDAPLSTGLFRNGSFGLIKVGVPLLPVLHPFAGAGLGLSYVSVQGQNTASRYESGFTLELPVSAGLEVDLLSVTIGVRGTLWYLLTQQFAKRPNVGGHLFDISATIGLMI
jgi:hypothetical protein